MKKDVLFRGCTRQPMILGVPYFPFIVGTGGPLMLSMYFNLYLLLLIPVSLVIMRIMTKKDEMIFRLIGLNLAFRFLPKNREMYGNSWVFGASKYSAKKAMRGYD